MRKYMYIALMGLLAGCVNTSTPEQKKSDMQSCLTEKATAYIQDGSAIAAPMRSTVKKMLNACVAPEVQTPEDKQLAQSILSSLMSGQNVQ